MRRFATMLASSVLLLGVAGAAPATADQAAGPGGGAATEAGATDARGDARFGSRAARRLADVRSIRYRAPQRVDGMFSAGARMSRVPATRRGPRQQVAVRLLSPNRKREWVLIATNRADGVRVFGPDGSRIEPRQSSSGATYGKGGRLSMSVSTEWLPVDRVTVRPLLTAYGRAIDFLRFPRLVLDMSGDSGVTVVEPTPAEPRGVRPGA